MSQQVQAYIKALQDELDKVIGEIARMERTKSRIEEKLRSPEKYFNKELKRSTVRVKKIFGEKVPEKKSPFKKQTVKVETIETPTVEMELPGPAATPGQEEKRKSGFGFFKG